MAVKRRNIGGGSDCNDSWGKMTVAVAILWVAVAETSGGEMAVLAAILGGGGGSGRNDNGGAMAVVTAARIIRSSAYTQLLFYEDYLSGGHNWRPRHLHV